MMQLLIAMRPRQWIKNCFVFLPLIFAGRFLSADAVLLAGAAFLAFSAAASAGYLVNDVYDRAADRAHPRKQYRPIASGRVSPRTAILTAFFLVLLALGSSFFLSPFLSVIIAAYLFLTVTYSFFLKHVVVLDVLTIAFGFVLRVFGGAVAIAVEPSEWLLFMTFFLALLLATGKRLQELAATDGGHRKSLACYSRVGLLRALACTLGVLGVAYPSYIFFAGKPIALFATLPIVWVALARYFFLVRDPAHSHDGPTELFFADRFLQFCVGLWVFMTLGILFFSI